MLKKQFGGNSIVKLLTELVIDMVLDVTDIFVSYSIYGSSLWNKLTNKTVLVFIASSFVTTVWVAMINRGALTIAKTRNIKHFFILLLTFKI